MLPVNPSPLYTHFKTVPFERNLFHFIFSFLKEDDRRAFIFTASKETAAIGAPFEQRIVARYDQLYDSLWPHFETLQASELVFRNLIAYMAQHVISKGTGARRYEGRFNPETPDKYEEAPPFSIETRSYLDTVEVPQETPEDAAAPDAMPAPTKRVYTYVEDCWIILASKENPTVKGGYKNGLLSLRYNETFNTAGEICLALYCDRVDHQKGIIFTDAIRASDREKFFVNYLNGRAGFPKTYLSLDRDDGQLQETLLIQSSERGGNLHNLWLFNDHKPLTSIDATNGLREISQQQLFRFAYRLMCAVKALHNEGIVHRDLTMANVVLDRDFEEPTIIDFGSTVFIGPKDKDFVKANPHLFPSASEPICGAYTYLPWDVIIEMQKGNLAKANQLFNNFSTDINALGLILGAILLGVRPPYWANKPTEQQVLDMVSKMHQEGELALDLPTNPIGNFILPMIQFDSTKRPSIATVIERFQVLAALYDITLEDNAPNQ